MPITDPAMIKKIVRSNFDKSAELYEEFEQKYGLFEYLTKELAAECGLQKGMSVCDIGCGSGTSSFVLHNLVGSDGKVYGIDFSEKMLEFAQEKLETQVEARRASKVNIEFILSDATTYPKNIASMVDMVLYNACIFLIPDYVESIKKTYHLLKTNGTIGMNYLIGIFDRNGDTVNQEFNLFSCMKQAGKPFAPYGRQFVDTGKLNEPLVNAGFRNIQNGILIQKMTVEEMREFYSIPAQSAGLWPKNSYEERLEYIKQVVDYLKEINIGSCYQYWGWWAAKK